MWLIQPGGDVASILGVSEPEELLALLPGPVNHAGFWADRDPKCVPFSFPGFPPAMTWVIFTCGKAEAWKTGRSTNQTRENETPNSRL